MIYISNFVAVDCWCFFVIVDGKPDLTISAPRFPHKHFVWCRDTDFFRGKISTCPLAPVVHSSLWAQSLSGTPKVYSSHRDSQQ